MLGHSKKCYLCGKIVDYEIYRHGIGKKEFAYYVEIERSNLYRILKKGSTDTDQLLVFSVELGHNFSRDMADEFERRKNRNEKKVDA